MISFRELAVIELNFIVVVSLGVVVYVLFYSSCYSRTKYVETGVHLKCYKNTFEVLPSSKLNVVFRAAVE